MVALTMASDSSMAGGNNEDGKPRSHARDRMCLEKDNTGQCFGGKRGQTGKQLMESVNMS